MNLRLATIEDCEILFAWRNDLATRLASRNSAPIAFNEHKRWLVKTLDNPKRALYVAELEGTPVGTVRTDMVGDVAEISWTVAPEHRGRGIGKLMVRTLAQSISGPIRAEVKGSNLASIRIAEAAGLSLEKTDGEMHHFRRG
jgi:RimJ/RimL family protein N-acetyltransferase